MSERIDVTLERIIQAGQRHPEAQIALRELFPSAWFEPVTIQMSASDALALRYLLRYNIQVVEYVRSLTGYNSWGEVPMELGRVMGRVGESIDAATNRGAR